MYVLWVWIVLWTSNRLHSTILVTLFFDQAMAWVVYATMDFYLFGILHRLKFLLLIR